MPLSWPQFKESGFDKSPYRDDLPTGTHLITIDQAAWGQGNSAGIHLFFTTDQGDKYWSFVKWMGVTPQYVIFKEVQLGNRFQIEVQRSKTGSPYIQSASKL